MTTGMLHLHSVLRYLVLFFALWAIFKSLSGMGGNKVFTKGDQKPGLFFMISMDVQLLVGLILYFTGGFGLNSIKTLGMGETMKNSITRFFAVEHLIGMLIALVLVHIGYATTKKAELTDQKKFIKSFWLYLVALVVIIASIPWPFREAGAGRSWFPGM
ncbi:MAG: hypothetical protein EOP54_10500 [Sphingobacteriales bacterium]|nr:MAG: hypothetical protein EOP54_10500 [Sphingobacteriales bacterium]